jgi:hypothetical protein
VDKSKILKNDVQEITEFQSIILGWKIWVLYLY